jgi:HlyD family secretion protein
MNYQPPSVMLAPEQPVDVLVDPKAALRKNMKIGLIAIVVLVFGLFGLAALVDIRGAVIAAGQVSVESKVKKIAHPTGGVISEIYVRDGMRVKKGDPLMRLDSRVAGVSATVSGEGLDQMLAMRARLEAERDGRGFPVFPVALTQRQDPSARAAMAEESRLFRLRREARVGQHAQLAERIRQLDQQIRGFQSQISASHRQSKLIQPELDGVRQLWEKKLVTINKVNSLERTAVDLEANVAALDANIAQARAKITEIRQQMIQLDQDARSEAGAQLAEVVAKLAEQQVRTVSSGDIYDKSVIRAPYDGIVDKLAFTTVGGVIPPAETIMEIVPDTDQFTVDAKISPADVDQLRVGQEALLRFSAFNTRTTPEVEGKLAHISAETKVDDRTGMSFYTVRIEIGEREIKELGNAKLVPGMPVEAYIQTGERSLLSYITKPLADQLNRAFRD